MGDLLEPFSSGVYGHMSSRCVEYVYDENYDRQQPVMGVALERGRPGKLAPICGHPIYHFPQRRNTITNGATRHKEC